MPVTGLPAALEIMLSTLLENETMSSFKVVGERNSTVVVLRFSSDVSQPSTTDRSTNCWRKKPPAQLLRDRRRRNRYQSTNLVNTGEQDPLPSSSSVASYPEVGERDSSLPLQPDLSTTQPSGQDAREKPAGLSVRSESSVHKSSANTQNTPSAKAFPEKSKLLPAGQPSIEEKIRARALREKWRRENENAWWRRKEAGTDNNEPSSCGASDTQVSSLPPVSTDTPRVSAAATLSRPEAEEEHGSANPPSRRQQPRRSKRR